MCTHKAYQRDRSTTVQRTNLLQLETRPQTVCGVPPDGRPRARGWGLVSLAPQLRWHSWHCAYWLGPWRGGQPHCPATGANEKESPRRFQMPLQLWKHAAHSPTICAYPTRHWAMARANSFVYSHSVARSMGQTIGQSSQGGKPRQGRELFRDCISSVHTCGDAGISFT